MQKNGTNEPIAAIKTEVIQALGLNCAENTPIYLGQSNIEHMKQSHPKEYEKYFERINEILNLPDYVGMNPSDNSIEYIREYQSECGEFVKVAVRVSASGRYYARSLYVLRSGRVQNFIQKGTLKCLKFTEE
ncbi:MAG: transposase [Selenomonadaceae bacterium]|nr:transposase [Selenomonadaceae bacterium]